MELMLGTAVVNVCLLFNDQQQAEGKHKMSIAKFREELSEKLMRVSTETISDVQGIGGEETEEIQYLRETQEREGDKENRLSETTLLYWLL